MKNSEYNTNKIKFTFAPSKPSPKVKPNKTYSLYQILVAMVFITCIVCLLVEGILPL